MHFDPFSFIPGVLLIIIGGVVNLSVEQASTVMKSIMRNVVGDGFAQLYSPRFLRFMGVAAIVVGCWLVGAALFTVN